MTDRQFIYNLSLQLANAWNNLTRGKTQIALEIIDEAYKSCLALLYFNSREEYDENVKYWTDKEQSE